MFAPRTAQHIEGRCTNDDPARLDEAYARCQSEATAAFGRGDVAAILEVVTDDVDWAPEAASKGAPWYFPVRNKGELPSWFQAIGESVEVEDFTPLSFASNDTEVHTVVRFGVRVRPTGKRGSMQLHHCFRFRGDKIEYYRGSEDTALTESLFRP
jgi:ketosteroid isomerase-like protein